MRIPVQSDENETVDRRILQEVYGVGEERNGADGQSHREFDSEISKVQQRNDLHSRRSAASSFATVEV